jgi:outer membrane protein TolC
MSRRRATREVSSGLCALLWLVPLGSALSETLEDAWNDALARDLTLQAAAERVAAAQAAVEAARGGRRPSLGIASTVTQWDTTPAFDFSGVGMPSQLALFGGQSMVMSEARVSFPLYTGGQVSSVLDATTASATARQAEAAALSLEVKRSVAEQFVAVLRAESALAVTAANAESLTAHARDVADMYASGQVPRNDQLAAAVSLADAKQKELQARNRLDVARAAYNRSTGRELDSPVALDPVFPSAHTTLAANPLDALVAMARENRQELASLDAAVSELTARSATLRGSTRPQLLLQGGWTFLENDFLNREDFWTVGVGFQWNLFDGGRSRDSAAALSYQASAAARERANMLTLIELDVRAAWLNVHETRERVPVTQEAVAQAEENLRVVRDRYRNGEGTNTEVLDAEALRSLSRNNYDTARYDAALAEITLARAVGLL